MYCENIIYFIASAFFTETAKKCPRNVYLDYKWQGPVSNINMKACKYLIYTIKTSNKTNTNVAT